MTTSIIQEKPTTANASPAITAEQVRSKLRAKSVQPEHIDKILWLFEHGKGLGMSNPQIGKLIGKDASTISKIFGGAYAADHANIAEDIEHFRLVLAQRESFAKEPFADLRIAREIDAFLDLTRVSGSMAWLWGPNQSGKTTSVRKYAADNASNTTAMRMPVGGGTKLFYFALMRAVQRGTRKSMADMRDIAFRYFNPNMLLIIDEYHQTMVGRSLRMVTIEVCRELHDECKVPMCFVSTDILPEMMGDAKFKNFLGQTDNRGVLRMRVPAKPYAEDVRAICHAYGLAPATGEAKEIVTQIAHTNGIGKLSKYLGMARRLATKQSQPVTWEHFLTTHSTLKSWAEGKGEQA